MYQFIFNILVFNFFLLVIVSASDEYNHQQARQIGRGLLVDQRAETLNIKKSGTATAPIIVEGNGETITGFDPMPFTFDGNVWMYTLLKPFETAPAVITWYGRRILQDQNAGEFIGPIKLRTDGKTLELTSGTSAEGWEISARLFVVALNGVSHHIYRNIIATGSLGDGFNLHGDGNNIIFENIAGYNNLDEGFSSHETISCTITNGRFWANDNGIANVHNSVTNITNTMIHDNVGYGLWLPDNTTSNLVDVRVWNNGAAQFRVNGRATGTATRVSVWKSSWSSPPWRRYMESKAIKNTTTVDGNAAYTSVPFWTGKPEIMNVSAMLIPINPTANSTVPSIAVLIQNAITTGRSFVVLPAGIHRLTDQINIRNATNLEVDGTGTTLIITNRKRSILSISKANNLVIRGLTFDYDPLPFTQGTITAITLSSITFKVHDGYPDLDDGFGPTPSAHLFKPDGRRHPHAHDFYKPSLKITTNRMGTLIKTGPSWPATLAIGDFVALDRRETDATNAVNIFDCIGSVTFEYITMLSSPSLSFVGRYNLDVVNFRRVTLRPGPRIENCDISHQGDDSLNVHGPFLKITNVLSNTRFQFTHPRPYSFLHPTKTGDTVRLQANGNFNLIGVAKFASYKLVNTSDVVTTYEINLLTSPTIPLAVDQWFDIPELNSPDYLVRDSYFHDHRARGLRLMASNGLVERNRFERLTKCAVLVGPEFGYWPEAGWLISIFVHTDKQSTPYPNDHSNIVIENNLIQEVSVAGIHAYAVNGLTIRGNKLFHTNLVRGPGTDTSTGLVTTEPISVSAAVNVTLEDYHILQ
ncbi:unnamed protein product [Adineta ricciae]|uniref:Right handed beta helix domain-containing protein n=1 Tax=Adineta ricciae TaxID=249248 RepID=A0A815SMR3_ADIRI|nr:unnamed protein product [Adineta ricciae]CAF1493957.1 unnamed protein product [Adineta ricciae]